jgi:pyruvate dehydrogenase E1 component alpha subunit/2-oxoisovalerate dehydrogenase E1 component alpha subunit
MLGAAIPLCAGVALAASQRELPVVALTYIGDGGSNTGDFHEGMNFAAALRLPLVVIVEDNGFAYSTPTSRHAAIERFADRGAAYGIPAATLDGNDVVAVYAATKQAVDRARAGSGPTLLEVKTFRMRGHAEHDDAFYVPKELLQAWERRDPINKLVHYMMQHGLLAEAERAHIDERVAREVEDGLVWAEQSPLPEGKTQARGVYAESL